MLISIARVFINIGSVFSFLFYGFPTRGTIVIASFTGSLWSFLSTVTWLRGTDADVVTQHGERLANLCKLRPPT